MQEAQLSVAAAIGHESRSMEVAGNDLWRDRIQMPDQKGLVLRRGLIPV